MQMVSLKTADDGDEMPGMADCCPCIYLNDDQVEALGIKSPPLPGKVYHLKVIAVAQSVTATAEEADEAAKEGNGPDVMLTLKLTDIEIVDSGKSTASVLYGE